MWDLSSMTRDVTHGEVSCIARQILYHWATREVPAIKAFRTTPNPLLVSREVPCSVLKSETVLGSLDATPKVP